MEGSFIVNQLFNVDLKAPTVQKRSDVNCSKGALIDSKEYSTALVSLTARRG